MLKFSGELDELREHVEGCGARGKWTALPNGSHQFRRDDGAILVWWPTNGTIQFQGALAPKNQLETELAARLGAPAPPRVPAPNVVKRQIFVVHGHDVDARDQLELTLHRLGLEPFILMNTSGGGKTIIEALEGQIGRDYSSDFGIALFTPDDVGYAEKDGPTKAEPRGRQNVVLETGMLLASLTRKRMAILVKGHVDLPSDLQGIIQLRFNTHIKEVVPKLCERFRESGIVIDPKNISAATT